MKATRKTLIKELRRKGLKDVAYNNYLRSDAADYIEELEGSLRDIVKKFPMTKDDGSISIQDMMRCMIEMNYIAVKVLDKRR